MPSVETQKLITNNEKLKSESSKIIQERVQKAREIQIERFKGTNIKSNSEMATRDVKSFCEFSEECKIMLTSAISTMNLSARSYFKVIKVARTIADLSEDKNISVNHIAEALQYRPKIQD